jgi:hypothetical protein
MKVKIKYHNIEHGASMFASPSFTNSEIVECVDLDDPKLISYIESKKDQHGNKFKISKKKSFGFDFISNQGAVKIEEYVEPEIKTL